MLFYRISVIFIIILVTFGCSGAGEENTGEDFVTLSALTSMVRTTAQGTAAAGLALGNPISSLQSGQLEPGVYTIQFTVLPPSDGAGFAAYAIVNWKAGGQQITRMVSVFSGAVISGVAESVDVKLIDVSQINTFGFATTPAPYQIGVNLSKGSRATIMQPATLVTQLSAIPIQLGGPNPNSVTFLVPPNAGVVSVLPIVGPSSPTAGFPATDIGVVQLNQAGTNLLAAWYPILQNPGWIPLFGGTVRIGISTNNANNASVNVIWGIEG